MKDILLALCIILLPSCASSQETEYIDTPHGRALLILPQDQPIKGIIIREFSQLPDTSHAPRHDFLRLSVNAGFAALYTSVSEYYPDMFLNDRGPTQLDSILHYILEAHPEIPDDKLFIGGISASGTRALRYVAYCNEGKSVFGHRIRAAFAVDSPLDMERFYLSSEKILARGHEKGNHWESNLITTTLDRELGGSPKEFPERYTDASVYVYSKPDSSQIAPYLGTAIRIYHEPDAQWWLESRLESVYEANMVDNTGFYVALISQGHTDAEIINTQNKGFDSDGNPKPHSWTIVDEPELVQWLLSYAD